MTHKHIFHRMFFLVLFINLISLFYVCLHSLIAFYVQTYCCVFVLALKLKQEAEGA